MTTHVRIGIIGDYNRNFHPHRATDAAINHAAKHLHLTATIEWLPTPLLVHHPGTQLRQFDALWCAPGSPYQSAVPYISKRFSFWHSQSAKTRNDKIEKYHAAVYPEAP